MTELRELFVIDPLIGKRQQLLLATQLCRMVLKVRWFVATPNLIFLCSINNLNFLNRAFKPLVANAIVAD